MKKGRSINRSFKSRLFFWLLLSSSFFGCKKDETVAASNSSNYTGTVPSVYTNTNVNPSSSDCFVEFTVTSLGGSPVTSCGICWSTDPDPTISSNSSEFGQIQQIGSYGVGLNGLLPATVYYAKAYVTNSYGTSYGNQITFTTTGVFVTVGQAYQGGVVAYILQPGDFGFDPATNHGIICSLADETTQVAWGCQGTLLGASGTLIGTGRQNSITIFTSSCDDFGGYRVWGGLILPYPYTDWYLPSKDELYQIYLNRSLIGGFNEGPHPNDNYWSSSEVDANNAWAISFSNGSVYANPKSSGNPANVRRVRSF